MEPVVNKLAAMTSQAYGDAETPVRLPSTGAGDEQQDEAAANEEGEQAEGEADETEPAPADETGPQGTEESTATDEPEEATSEADEADAGAASGE